MIEIEQHETKIATSVDTAKYPHVTYYRAICLCGWIGVKMTKRDDAQEEADEHVRILGG